MATHLIPFHIQRHLSSASAMQTPTVDPYAFATPRSELELAQPVPIFLRDSIPSHIPSATVHAQPSPPAVNIHTPSSTAPMTATSPASWAATKTSSIDDRDHGPCGLTRTRLILVVAFILAVIVIVVAVVPAVVVSQRSSASRGGGAGGGGQPVIASTTCSRNASVVTRTAPTFNSSSSFASTINSVLYPLDTLYLRLLQLPIGTSVLSGRAFNATLTLVTTMNVSSSYSAALNLSSSLSSNTPVSLVMYSYDGSTVSGGLSFIAPGEYRVDVNVTVAKGNSSSSLTTLCLTQQFTFNWYVNSNPSLLSQWSYVNPGNSSTISQAWTQLMADVTQGLLVANQSISTALQQLTKLINTSSATANASSLGISPAENLTWALNDTEVDTIMASYASQWMELASSDSLESLSLQVQLAESSSILNSQVSNLLNLVGSVDGTSPLPTGRRRLLQQWLQTLLEARQDAFADGEALAFHLAACVASLSTIALIVTPPPIGALIGLSLGTLALGTARIACPATVKDVGLVVQHLFVPQGAEDVPLGRRRLLQYNLPTLPNTGNGAIATAPIVGLLECGVNSNEAVEAPVESFSLSPSSSAAFPAAVGSIDGSIGRLQALSQGMPSPIPADVYQALGVSALSSQLTTTLSSPSEGFLAFEDPNDVTIDWSAFSYCSGDVPTLTCDCGSIPLGQTMSGPVIAHVLDGPGWPAQDVFYELFVTHRYIPAGAWAGPTTTYYFCPNDPNTYTTPSVFTLTVNADCDLQPSALPSSTCIARVDFYQDTSCSGEPYTASTCSPTLSSFSGQIPEVYSGVYFMNAGTSCSSSENQLTGEINVGI